MRTLLFFLALSMQPNAQCAAIERIGDVFERVEDDDDDEDEFDARANEEAEPSELYPHGDDCDDENDLIDLDDDRYT